MFRTYNWITIGLITLAIAGCGSKSEEKGTDSSTPAPSLDAALSPQTIEKARQSSLPKADANTPPERFVELNSGNQLMFMYYALSKIPVDYDQVAQAYSREYRETNDGFRKQDILAAIKPRITGEIENAKTMRYLKIPTDNPIGKYDFAQRAFPVTAHLEKGGYFSWGDNNNYTISFSNGDQFKQLKVLDEEKARKIEAMLSKYQPVSMTIYAYAQDVDPNIKQIIAQIVRVQLTDQNGAELATQQ